LAAAVTDALHNARVARGGVAVTVTPAPALAALLAGADAAPARGVCAPADDTGACLAAVALPDAWFAAIDANPGVVLAAAVAYGFKDTLPEMFAAAGTVTLKARLAPLTASRANQLCVVAPTATIFAGQTFAVPVYQYVSTLLASFTLRVTVGEGLVLAAAAVDAGLGADWSARVSVATDGHSLAFVAFRSPSSCRRRPARRARAAAACRSSSASRKLA